MNEQIRVQQLLQRKFLEIKTKNPSFSVRALANRIEMQPGATNEILKGQRRVSRKIAEKIADKLQLDPSERTDLLRDYPERLQRKSKTKQDLEVLKLNSDQFELISEWTHFAILSLIKVKDFKSDVSWIADRLGVTELEARKAILRLQHLKLIHIDEKGRMTRTPHPVRTSDDVRDLGLQRMHMNDMDLAKKKIQDVNVDQRDFSNYTFPANPKTMARAKEILRKAQDDLEELMSDDDAEEVYRVCMYLFPLTKLENK